MRKYVLSFLLVMIAGSVMAQKKSIVNLIQSESSTGIKINGKDVIKVYKGVFKQDYSILRSDSAYFYPKQNAFDAFGNVNINQGDTLNIYSDKLNYNGNTKIAILTNNVKMVDKDATLTTDYLTYNTATRVGTYTGGGKLVNRDNTLTSKNGYYFAFSRDSYFRYNVVLVTIDAVIKTDTLRYNTGTRISYFYGPTNIYGTKDKDTLYTENGLYNTITEQAFFGKKNFYKQGTKSLKGDSLFYDKLKGYGRAVKNITFNDNEQKITLKGDLGTYFRADERTVVTQYAYAVMVTEQKDTTKTDSTAKIAPLPIANSKDKASLKKITNLEKVAQDSKPDFSSRIPKNSIPIKQLTDQAAAFQKDTATMKKLTALSQTDTVKKVIQKITNMAGVANGIKPYVKGKTAGKSLTDTLTAKVKPPGKVKRDSIFLTADTLETQIMTFKNLKAYQQRQRAGAMRDTSAKARKLAMESKSSYKFLTLSPSKMPKDTGYLHRYFFGKPKPVNDSLQRKKAALAAIKKAKQDSIARVELQRDPVYQTRVIDLKDTARVRILLAHHHAKIFKSDLQAKADSIFYSNADSTIRCYVRPIIWTQGSQLSGDTVYLAMRNKKLDNMDLFPSAFIVNIEKDDSTHFNQVAGKKMRGYFKDDKLERMYVAGNAESIYFQRDSGKISGMQRSLSSRIRVTFKDGKASNAVFLTKPDHKYGPLSKFSEDDRVLKGFIWKPKERPVSKESIIPNRNKRPANTKPAAKAPPGKPGIGKPPAAKADSLKTGTPKTPGDSIKTNGALQDTTLKLPAVKAGKDTIVKKPPIVNKKQ